MSEVMLNAAIDGPIEYARARFGDAVSVQVLEADVAVILHNTERSVEIELHRLGDYYVVFAGSLWLEAMIPGTRPVLWLMDLAMTFGVVEFRALLATVSLAAPQESVESYGRLPWRREVRRWAAWSGQVADRSEVAERFGMREPFGPDVAKSITVAFS